MTDTVSPISSGPSPELTAQIEAYRVNGLRFIIITAFPTDVAAALEQKLNSSVDALVAAVAVNPAPIAVPAVVTPFRAPKLTPLVDFYGAGTADPTPTPTPAPAPAPAPTPTPAPAPAPAPDPNAVMLTGSKVWTLNNMVKAANTDTFTATVADWTSSAILSSKSMAADGYVVVKLKGDSAMLAFRTSTANGGYTSVRYGVVSGGGVYQRTELGAGSATAVATNPNHFVKLARVGGIVSASYSTDNITYSPIYNWGSSTTEPLFAAIHELDTAHSIEVISLVGFA